MPDSTDERMPEPDLTHWVKRGKDSWIFEGEKFEGHIHGNPTIGFYGYILDYIKIDPVYFCGVEEKIFVIDKVKEILELFMEKNS